MKTSTDIRNTGNTGLVGSQLGAFYIDNYHQQNRLDMQEVSVKTIKVIESRLYKLELPVFLNSLSILYIGVQLMTVAHLLLCMSTF